MKRILLLAPFYKKNRILNARCDLIAWSGTQWYPIQLMYLGAFLESKGYIVCLLDAQAEGLGDIDMGAVTKKFKPDYCVIYAGRESKEFDKALCKMFNEKICPAKVAGPFYALWHTEAPGIYGELEYGVLDWIEGRVKNPELPIPGRALTAEELTAIPWVSKFALRQLNTDCYRAPSEPWPFIDIMTGRGCYWGKCKFCLWPETYKRGYTARDMIDVIAEIGWIEKNTAFKSIMLEDDSLPEGRIIALCEQKLKYNIKIKWSCLVRADLSFDTLKLMKQANCLNLHIGFESGNDRTLENVNKGLTVSQMEKFAQDARKAGLKIHGDFMIGIDDTQEQVFNTINWACKLRPHTAQFQIYIPYFGESKFKQDFLEAAAKYAYMKFYGNPRNWGAVIKQIGKPRILREAIKAVLK